MRSITERKNKDGTSRFQVIVRVAGLPSVTKTCATREAAEKYAEAATVSMRVKAPRQPRGKCLSEAEFERETLRRTIELFVLSSSATKRNKKESTTILKHIGSVKNGELNEEWLENYIAHMRSEKTNIGRHFCWATIKSHIAVLNKARRWRCRRNRLPYERLPFDIKTMFPRYWDTRRDCRLADWEEKLLRTRLRKIRHRGSRRFWLHLLSLALETAARQQELLFATWDHVDLDAKLWKIPREHCKTAKDRVVPLSRRALRVFRCLHALRHPGSNRVFHELGMPDSVSALFRRYARQAGLVDFRFHDLRHEACARLVIRKRKLSIFEIMTMVGHSSLEMLTRYANLRPEELVGRLE